MLRIRAEPAEGILGQANIGGRFQLAGDFQDTGRIQQGKSQQEAGDILAGNAAVNGVMPGAKLSGAVDGVRRWAGKGTAHPLHLLPHGGKRTLGQTTFQKKSGIHPQRTGHRQEKTEGRAAFAAVEHRFFGKGSNGMDDVAGIGSPDIRA